MQKSSVRFAYFLFHFDWLPKVTRILWSTESGMIRVPCSIISPHRREMGFSFPSCSLMMHEAKIFKLSLSFYLLCFLGISHITWHAWFYDKDSPGLLFLLVCFLEQSWLINWLARQSVIFIEWPLYLGRKGGRKKGRTEGGREGGRGGRKRWKEGRKDGRMDGRMDGLITMPGTSTNPDSVAILSHFQIVNFQLWPFSVLWN